MMKKNKSNLVSTFRRLRFILMVIVFVAAFIAHTQKESRIILKCFIQDLQYLKDINASYDEKMRRKWGWYYDFICFIKENTPEDASILLPPQNSRYPKIGNLSFNGYFLVPRSLHHGNQETLQNLKPPVYVVVCKEFPPFKVEGLKIMKDSKNGLIYYQPKLLGEQ